MIQPDLFDPATWGAALPLGPWVKRPWTKPTYVIEEREPTVADLLSGHWEPAPWPEDYACIYKATLIGTTRAYVGKAVDLRDRFLRHMRNDQVIDRALKKHGPESFSIEVLRVFETEADAYAQEDSFIEAHRTLAAHGGYNIGEGGKGYTSEEAREMGAAGAEEMARRARYPQRRVLADLKKGPRTTASLVAALGLNKVQVQHSFATLRLNGHHIIGERWGLWRLVTLEEAADDWASGDELWNHNRVLGALMEGPRTMVELMAMLGAPSDSVVGSILRLRKREYNIENRGGRGGHHPGTYHLIIDHKRHTWLHLGTLDLRGEAFDDRE